MNIKYELIRGILKNGDICFMKTWDNKYTFGLYMDDRLYKTQSNDIVVALGGFEPQVVRIERSQSMRNAFDCFRHAPNMPVDDYDISQYGKFDTVYIEQ